MLKFEFKISSAGAALARAKAVLVDMTPIMQDVAEYVTEITRQHFVDGKGPDGQPWAPKKPSTLARYERLGYGNLDRVLIGPGKALSRQIVSEATPNAAIVGSSLIYSGVMQDGAEKGAFGKDRRGRPVPWGKIAAREWLYLTPKDEAEIVAIAEEHVADRLSSDTP
ncbi:MAG: phage virion morphogenesis protein [Sphingomonadales bacterium]|nr:phage virion morphogenesis protein [Sphingomonadales bacterium]MDE2171336.1 phage virion morphogenesis protein [Sphingomonadales bacterium]